ncbi:MULTISPECIES: hypothetical protein [Stenotrophomonas]|jgi:hypothetical protein|nr:hypothetical protein [Stenotrophomonas indicatrix]MDN8647626.1 hypothetical protein [Stenotrophomonas indicatrix]
MTISNMEIEMNNAMQTRSAGRTPRRSRLGAIVLSGALLLSAQNANAGLPVIDYSSIMQEFRAWIDQTIEYGKEATRWKQIKQQIDDARALFSAMNFLMNMPQAQELKRVKEDYLVAETCGQDAVGLSLTNLFDAVGFKADKDIKEQQKQICVNIRMMQNRKFNDSVDFMTTTSEEMEKALYENFMARLKSDKIGNVQAADSDAKRLGNQLQAMSQQWVGRMQAYDAYIAVMEANQNVIAQAALKGDPKKKLASDLVRTAALKTALSID